MTVIGAWAEKEEEEIKVRKLGEVMASNKIVIVQLQMKRRHRGY